MGGVGVGGEGGVSRVTAQNRLSRTRLAQQWGGVSKPLNLEDDKWYLKETVKHSYCIKSSVKGNYRIYGGLIEWVSGE